MDVLVIGAGPSGAIASALLVNKGYRVCVLEKEQFPRFSIGESLLPQCMKYIEEAGMLAAVHAAGFQFKCGAAFLHAGRYTEFDFRKKFSQGWGTTYQVERGRFDKILADEAQRMGADVRYGHEITAVDMSGDKPSIRFNDADGKNDEIEAEFVIDASGFGRVLPRLFDLNTPSDFPVRQSVFAHVSGLKNLEWYDQQKILITIHPTQRDVWYWLIPFGEGRASIGVVARQDFFQAYDDSPEKKLKAIVAEEPQLFSLLDEAQYTNNARQITGYSANVKTLYGKGYALLGNAGEFLDPVFSSGVTIAMKSASMAVDVLDRQFQGEAVDWEKDFSQPLKKGVDTFRHFVEAWYDQPFQDIIFHEPRPNDSAFDAMPMDDVRGMISSILAGYAWDEANPYVKDTQRRLGVLAEICQSG